MADYKDYIVRYDVVANTINAVGAIKAMQDAIIAVETPAKTTATAIQDISKAIDLLAKNKNIIFKPQIDTNTFKGQLRKMVTEVRTAANEMHAAIYQALTGSPKALTQLVRNAGEKQYKLAGTTKGMEEQLAREKARLAGVKKSYERIANTLKKTGLTGEQMIRFTNKRTQNTNIQKELRGRIKELERGILLQKAQDQRAEELAKAQQKSQQITQPKSTVVSKSTPKPTPSSNPASTSTSATPLTNSDSQAIKDWVKVFGKSKSQTLTLKINATASGPQGALTIIKKINASLAPLKKGVEFTITPVVNKQAFSDAESRLTKLATLSAAIANPFISTGKPSNKGNSASTLSKEDKAKVSAAKKQIKALNNNLIPIQQRLDKNQAIPEDKRSSGVKGQITRDLKKRSELEAKKAEQQGIVSNIQSKAGAATKAAAKKIKPMAIDVVGNITKVNPPATTPTIPVHADVVKLIQQKTKPSLPVDAKFKSSQVKTALNAIKGATLKVNVSLVTTGIQEQLNAVGATLTPKGKVTKGSATQSQSQTQATPTAPLPPVAPAIPGTATTSISSTTPVGKVSVSQQVAKAAMLPYPTAKLEEQQSKAQNILPAPPTVKNTSPTTNVAGKKPRTPRTANASKSAQEKYATLKQKAAEKADKIKTDQKFRIRKNKEFQNFQAGMKYWRDKRQSFYDKIFGASSPNDDPNWLAREEQKRARELGRMREDSKVAFSKLTPFEQKEKADARKIASQTSILSHRNKLGKMSSAIKNSILPFVSNQGDLESIFKHYKSFAKVNRAMGQAGANGAFVPFMPSPSMTNTEMLQYLKKVEKQIQADGKAVPVKMQNYMKGLEEQIQKANNPAPAKPSPMAAPTGFMGSGKSRVFFGNTEPSAALAPQGYHWEKTNGLASKLNNEQVHGYQNALAERKQASQNLRSVFNSTQSAINQGKNPTSPYLTKLSDISNKLTKHSGQAILNLGNALNTIDRLNEENRLLKEKLPGLQKDKAALTALKKLNPRQGDALKAIQTQINETQQKIAANEKLIAQNKVIAGHQDRIIDQSHKRQDAILAKKTAEEERLRHSATGQPLAQRKGAVQAYAAASKGVQAYTNGYQLVPNNAKPAKPSIPKATKTQRGGSTAMSPQQLALHNQMSLFATNKGQFNVLTKYHRFFEVAAKKTGITPTRYMPAPKKLNYLQGVSGLMRNYNTAVPWELQREISKLYEQIANEQIAALKKQPASKGRGVYVGRGGYAPISVAPGDRFRKWAYPLTGQTSFGARTPMAVDMAKSMGVMFAISGAMSAIGSSFSQAMEYQNTMKTTQAILQHGTETYTTSGFQNMEEIVRNVGIKTKFSAPEVASAAKFLAMAGMDINAINSAIRPIADLALIGDTDLGETADKMTNIMTTFGYNSKALAKEPNKVREFANIMATTATRSNTDVMMLAESAKYGGGVAHMYGKNDPNLFADTMAMFGVMGNAGIQGSSAGTALRMMYQNIFKPNDKQKKVLKELEKYGVHTKNEDNTNKSMADVISQIANLVPDEKIADVVGSLFRITAQPGASSTIMAATEERQRELVGAAKEDGSNLEESAKGIEKLADKMETKKGLSDLASLMEANRASIYGNISNAIAEEKQNTIQGLWAQVTSTFTEGIVKAFEQRKGGFESMLKALRDYMAKPETVRMLQNLLDMIVQIGKVMAWFVKIWASLYNLAPGMIKSWVVAQMAITQIGSLIGPFVMLTNVFDRLRSAIGLMTGASVTAGRSFSASSARIAAGSAATMGASSLYAPFVVGTKANGKKSVIRGAAAVRANKSIRSIESAALTTATVASLKPAPASMAKAKNFGSTRNMLGLTSTQVASEKAAVQAHYAEVKARANRRYGWTGVVRNIKSGFKAVPSALMFAPFFANLKSMFFGLMRTLGKGIGLLGNPITLAIGALAAVGFGFYKLTQRIKGTTDAQQIVEARTVKAANATASEMYKDNQWHRDLFAKEGLYKAKAFQPKNKEKLQQYEASRQTFKTRYKLLFEDITKDANKSGNQKNADRWRQTMNSISAYRLALGDRFEEYAGDELTNITSNNLSRYNGTYGPVGSLSDLVYADDNYAKALQKRMMKGAIMTEATHNPEVQQAVKDIIELRKKLLNKTKDPKTNKEYSEEDYKTETADIRTRIQQLFPVTVSSENLTIEQYRNSSDRSKFDLYQEGALNFIDAYINGSVGSVTAMLNSMAELNGKVKAFTPQWYELISNTISQYRVFDDFVSADGKQKAQIELAVNMMPNNKIDLSYIKHQVEEKIDKFKESLQQYSNIMATVYQMMIDNGQMTAGDVRKKLWEDFKHADVTEQTAWDYYNNYVANNPDNIFYKSNIEGQDFVNLVLDKSNNGFGKDITLADGSKKNSAGIRNMIRWMLVEAALGFVHDKPETPVQSAQKAQDAVPKTPEVPVAPAAPATPTPPPAPKAAPAKEEEKPKKKEKGQTAWIPYAPVELPWNSKTPAQGLGQSAYAFNWNKPKSEPQVVVNVNNLANFDRLSIPSNTEEKDLMNTIQEKITSVVHQIFTEASNGFGATLLT